MRLVKILEEESGFKAVLHDKIIVCGVYHTEYATGKERPVPVSAFSPRQQYIVVYVMTGTTKFKNELKKLGKHRSAKVCLYINKLADIDEKVLRKIIKQSVAELKNKYQCENA